MEHGQLKVGFIGAGANTRSMHLPGFQKQAAVELSAVANRTRNSAEAVAARYGIKRVYDRWQDLVADPSIHAVCIGTWPYLHAEATLAALQAGKHVLCEARMANDLSQARAMLAAAQAHPGLVAQLVPAPFSLDFDRTIRELIAGGRLGRLLEVRVVHTGGHLASPDAPMTWRQDLDFSGKNILSMGILHETVQRWLQDEPEWLLADGCVFHDSRCYPDDPQRTPVRVPDSVSILGRFAASGARLVYHFSGVESGKPRMEFRPTARGATL